MLILGSKHLNPRNRNVPRAYGGVTPPIFSNLPERWSKVSHAAREIATAFFAICFSVTIIGQLVKTPPPNGKCPHPYIPASQHTVLAENLAKTAKHTVFLATLN